MVDNIVNIENEYFKKKTKDAYEALMNKKFKDVIEILAEPIEKIEGKIKGSKVYCPQNIFDASIFLNFLEPKAEQEDFAKINYYDLYLMMGAANYNLNNYDEATKFYKKAVELNPASSVARLQLLEINKVEKHFDNFTDDIKDLFKFAYRRADMAKAYRDMGYFLYEKKDYELSIVAYYLSNVYEVTELSMKEAKHISEIANIDLDSKQWLSEEMMGEFYDKYKIPLLPDQGLAKLADVIAADAYEKKAFNAALFLNQVAYELTLEQTYLDKINELKDKNN